MARKAPGQKNATALLIPHAANQCFHVIEITLERPATGSGQTVLGLGRASLKRFRTADITRVFQLPGMHAEIAVGGLDQVLELVEGERFVGRQRADNSQPQPFMNHPIDLMRTVRRAAVHAAQLFLIGKTLL